MYIQEDIFRHFSPTGSPFHRLELTFQAIEPTFHPMEQRIYRADVTKFKRQI